MVVGGCSYYEPELGPAYEPWGFPDDALPPNLRLVHAATLASSGHNTQPWSFRVEDRQIELRAVPGRHTGTLDPLRREATIGLGCALQNLEIAAVVEGFEPLTTLFPSVDEPSLAARIELQPSTPREHPLYASIATRHTNRGKYGDFVLSDALYADLERNLDGIPDVRLILLRSDDEKRAFRQGTIAATEAIIGDHEMHADSDAWFRHTHEEITEHRDGITLDASGLGAATRFFGKSGKRPTLERSGSFWLKGTEARQTTGSAFGILATPTLDDSTQAVWAGFAWQRLHLWMQSVGLSAQPLNQMAERRDRERTAGLEPRFGAQLEEFTGPDLNAQLLFRLGYAWDDPLRSPRRPVDWVVES